MPVEATVPPEPFVSVVPDWSGSDAPLSTLTAPLFVMLPSMWRSPPTPGSSVIVPVLVSVPDVTASVL